MSEMVSKLVAAAKTSLLDDPDSDAWMDRYDSSDDFRIDGHVNLDKMMRAVLQAMREPTREVLDAAIFTQQLRSDRQNVEGDYHWMKCSWQSAIDTALGADHG